MKKLIIAFCLFIDAFAVSAQVVKPDAPAISPAGPNTKVYYDLKIRGSFFIPHYSLTTPPIGQDTIGKFVLNTDDNHVHVKGTDMADHKLAYITDATSGGGSHDTIYFKKFTKLVGTDTLELFTDTSATSSGNYVLALNSNGYLIKLNAVYSAATNTITYTGIKINAAGGLQIPGSLTGQVLTATDTLGNMHWGAGSTNIYNSDGTFTGIRTATIPDTGAFYLTNVDGSVGMFIVPAAKITSLISGNPTGTRSTYVFIDTTKAEMAFQKSVLGISKSSNLTISDSKTVFTDRINSQGILYSHVNRSNFADTSVIDKKYSDSTNFYKSNGVLTGDRNVNGAFHGLFLDSLGIFQVNVPINDPLGVGSMYLNLNGSSGNLGFHYGNGDQYNIASDDGGGFGPTEFLIGGGNVSANFATLNWYSSPGGIYVRDVSGNGLVAAYGVDTTKMGTSLANYVTSGWVLGRLHSLPGIGTTTNAVTFNNSGSGATSPTTFNGSAAKTISYNTIGAQQALTLTTTGTNGAATLSAGTLNIPQYSGATGANPTATAGVTAVNGSATTFMRSDAAPKVDSTVFRTVANSYTLAALQTKFNGYVLSSALLNHVAGYGLTGSNYNTSVSQIWKVDTTSVQTISNLFPKGDTRYLKATAAKMRLGTVLNNSLTASTGYTASGSTTTWAFTSSGLTASGGSNDNTNTQTFTSYYTNATNYSTSITFKPTAYGNGLGVGLNSNNGQLIGRMSLSGGVATLYIDAYRSGTIYNKVTGANTLAFALNDNIQLTLSRFNYDWYLFANDLTSGVSVSCQVNDPLTYGSIAFEWAAANPTIFAYGGNQTITNHSLSIGNYVQNDVLILGNSIAVGMQSGNPNATFASLLGQYYANGVNLEAGGGNTTATDVQLLPEIVALKPRFLIFTDGVNDAISGVSAATTEANMQTIITTCIANNITPVFCTILPVSGTYGGASNATIQAEIVTLNTYINALKNVTIIDTYTALSSAGVLNPSYDSGDGIHINTAGHLQYYNTMYTTLSGNYMINVTPNPTASILATSNNWTGAPQTLSLTNLAATATDGWRYLNTTAATAGVTVQNSPSLHYSGNVWNPIATASQAFDWKIFAAGASVNPITTNLIISSSINGGGYAANQFQFTNAGQFVAPTIASDAAATSPAFESNYTSPTGSNFYLLSAGGTNIASFANLNFAGASAINYRWFMAGSTAITPGGNNAVAGGVIGTQHVVFPTTGVTPIITQLEIKPAVIDAGSGGTITNLATVHITGSATGATTVTGGNYSLWSQGLNRLDSVAVAFTGLIKANGSTSPWTLAVAGTDYVGLASANTLTGKTTFNPSISASANLAQGSIFTPTLTAVANNDVLVGADFNPTIAGVGIINTLGSVTGGSAYTAGTYTSVPLTGGNGSGAVATVVVVGTAVSTVTITTAGTRYVVGDVLSAAAANIGGTGSGFSVPVATLTQTVTGAPIRATVSNIGAGNGIAGSWSDGILLVNPTTATSTLSQNAPSIHFQSQGYNTGSSASQTVDSYIVGAGQSGATTPGSNIGFLFYQNGTKLGTNYAFAPSLAVFTGAQLQLTHSSQGATVFTSLALLNVTPSTSGTPNQWTNQFYMEGTVWNTGGTPANNPFAFGLIGQGTSSANPYATQYFQTYLGTSTTPTFVNTASLTTQGQFSLGLSNTNIQAGSQAGSIFNIAASTLTDNSTASGTVTNFSVVGTGLTTLAATNASITYTNGYGAFFTQPTNGTNVTMTNKYALGLAYDATHLATFAVNSAGLLTINATSTIAITPATTFSATVSGPTAAQNTNTTQLASTAFVESNVLTRRTLTAVNASATLTAAQMQSGTSTSSTTAVAFTTPTAAQLYTQFGNPAQGSSFFYVCDNTASTSAGAITFTLGTGLTSGLNPGLTVPIGKSQTYMITFTSSTTAVMSQIN